MSKEACDWWVLTLGAPCEAYGDVMGDLLSRIRAVVPLSCALIGNIEGPETHWLGNDRGYAVFSMDELIPLVRKVGKFEWGDILCYNRDDRIPSGDPWQLSYPDLIGATEVTVRAVDGGGIEIATECTSLRDALVEWYPIAESYYGSLSEYTFME